MSTIAVESLTLKEARQALKEAKRALRFGLGMAALEGAAALFVHWTHITKFAASAWSLTTGFIAATSAFWAVGGFTLAAFVLWNKKRRPRTRRR
jgi:hypothetical protein